MKTLRNVLLACAVLTASPSVGLARRAPPPPPPPTEDVRVVVGVDFYDALSPWGAWVWAPDYGWCWVPDPAIVGIDFMPYATFGYWIDTDIGWTFQSYWDWGWAPFHYGRWFFHPRYGWTWYPDRDWGPAWVDWRYGGGYVGWAPLPPPRHGRVIVDDHRSHWVFVQQHQFTDPDVHGRLMDRVRAQRAMRLTRPQRTPIAHEHVRWYEGPPPALVQRDPKVPIPRRALRPPPAGRVERVPFDDNNAPPVAQPPPPRGDRLPPTGHVWQPRPQPPHASVPGNVETPRSEVRPPAQRPERRPVVRPPTPRPERQPVVRPPAPRPERRPAVRPPAPRPTRSPRK